MKEKITLDKTKNEVHKIVCRNCDNTTNHLVCSSIENYWSNEDIQGHDTYEMVRCSGCDSISFRVTSGNSEDWHVNSAGYQEYDETEELYPNRLMGRTPLQDIYSLPIKIRSIYQETHAALCAKLNILASIGIRSLVEAVCSEKLAKGRVLEKKIDDLVLKGVLTKGNSEILHRTRLLGNKATHETEVPSEAELDVAFDIVENLIETVYIIPRKAELLKK